MILVTRLSSPLWHERHAAPLAPTTAAAQARKVLGKVRISDLAGKG